MPGFDHIANIIDSMISRDFISAPCSSSRIAMTAAILLVAGSSWVIAELLPTRLAARGSAGRGSGRHGAAGLCAEFVGALR